MYNRIIILKKNIYIYIHIYIQLYISTEFWYWFCSPFYPSPLPPSLSKMAQVKVTAIRESLVPTLSTASVHPGPPPTRCPPGLREGWFCWDWSVAWDVVVFGFSF